MLHDDIESPLDVTGASGARDCDAIRSDLLLAVPHDPWRERRTEVLRPLAGVIIFLEPSDRGEDCGKPNRWLLYAMLHLQDEAVLASIVEIGEIGGA